ncbi:hypothetical protein KP509_18G047600 [Ceratopteris richardii]|uniref:Kinesin motor domain-containing protein n=1 Tax=Ceratopteris richardii TaxID=49495 RepID=A0A8T2SQ38_CERRI|nr:hypothetical protein KP509_18G047600 [Ceratopteris richardii]
MNPEETVQVPSQCARGRDKILVTVRVRPLSSREESQNDTSVWECTDCKTITFRPSQPDRSPHPKSYTFDRVFGPDSSTYHVYEEGAKEIALSALTGLNATIFAYGQTSSGKTFTMRGITECAIQDIYAYMEQHRDRNFVLKLSALEIYNEIVKDMLHPESGPLRLLDDPEKGTIVERLLENSVQDIKHLKEILSNVEAQRQVGETLLNDRSSRSHQIVRLTVESSSRSSTNEGHINSLVASLNFVDLAGSERASQTLSGGTRLKEGCHINRSLLTLTTIIRKLSGQGRGKSGHLPYRDSKLTRILQNSLGGNARTAIICTMSPAQSHVEQSRNTLFFATQAKEVVNTAQVNVVVSDKTLVKQLQKEVARLEAELRIPEMVNSTSVDTEALLHEKNAEIQQLRAEMRELYQQRDQAQARLDEVLKKMKIEEEQRAMENLLPCPSVSPVIPKTCTKSISLLLSPNKRMASEEDSNLPIWKISPLGRRSMRRSSMARQSAAASMILVQEIRKLEHLQDELGEDAGRALEALQKEVECLRLAQSGMNHDAATTIAKLQAEIGNLPSSKASRVKKDDRASSPANGLLVGNITSLREEISRLHGTGDTENNVTNATIATLEEHLNNVQKSLDDLVLKPKSQVEMKVTSSPRTPYQRKPQTPLSVGSSNNRRVAAADSVSSPRARRALAFDHNENNPPNSLMESRFVVSHKQKPSGNKKEHELHEFDSKSTPRHQKTNSLDLKKMQSMFKTAAEQNIRSIRAYVEDLKERVAKLQYQKQLLVCQVLELEANASTIDEEEEDADMICMDDAAFAAVTSPIPQDWPSRFQKQRMQIVKLWDVCQVSIIHRSQFFLLFKGEPADEVYMEVELRRLTWLQEHFSQTSCLNGESGCEEEEPSASLAASQRALKREREQLARRMRVRLTEAEKEEIYQKWDVALDSKQRKLQVINKIWTKVEELSHIQESAQLVARVVGFWEPGKEASKAMFELTFAPLNNKQPWLLGWNSFLNNLAL